MLKAVVSLRPPSTFNDRFDSSFTFAGKAFLNDLIAKSGHKSLEGAPMMPRHGVSEERPSAGGGRAVPPRAAATA